MPVDPPFNVYRDQLTALSHGLALWNPKPPKKFYNNVSIGDVGYLHKGTFIRMFNVMLPWDDPLNKTLGDPEFYEPLNCGPSCTLEDSFDRAEHCSRYVSIEGNAGNMQAITPDDAEGVTYTFRNRGALLSLPNGGRHEDVIRTKAFEDYIRDHVVSWYTWAQKNKLGVERMEELILVSGCTLVTSWAAAVLVDNTMKAEISLASRTLSNGEASFVWSNNQGAVVYHNSRFDPQNPPTAWDQCVFIRGFRAKRVLFWTRRIRAGAEPLPDDPDNRRDDEIQETGGSGVLEHVLFENRRIRGAVSLPDNPDNRRDDEIQVTQVPNVPKYRDPLVGVLDYIVEKCIKDDMAEDTIAITHDNDLQLIEGVETLTADAIEKFLREKQMPLLVKNGAAILCDPRNNEHPVLFKKKATSYVAPGTSQIPAESREDRPRFPSTLQRPLSNGLKLPSLPDVPGTDFSRAVLDSFKVAIAKCVADALPPLTVEQVYRYVDYGKNGVDFTIALSRFPLPGEVDVLAKTVIDQFQADDFVESVTQDNFDKAFLHFMLKTPSLVRAVLTQVHELTYDAPSGSPEYGTNTSGTGKKVVIEYSSPNIAKSFDAGHLRSTIIGAFLANLYKSCGWEVVSMNYLGDWGTQFGLIAVGFEKYGSEEELQKDAIKHLFDVYVNINKDAESDPGVKAAAAAWFKRMEDGDEDALKNWRVWRELSVKKYADEYERLNVHFDVYTGESKVGKKWQDFALERLNEMGLISDVEGAKLVDLEKWKLGKAVLRKKDGTSIYLTRDIGGAIERYEQHKFDKMLYVISSQQDLHTAQFIKMLHLMEFPWASSIEHVNYELVFDMNTREGNIVFLEQIIREAASVMYEQMKKNREKYVAVEDPEQTSLEVGLAAIKIQDMALKRINHYSFNWNRVTSFEGDTGPYLQYTHVHLTSLTRKNPELLPLPAPDQIAAETLAEQPAAREIAFLLGTYPDVVRTALRTHEPSGVVTFAFRLAHAVSSALEMVVVKGEKDVERARARMWLYLCARDVLGAAMRLLSIRPLERM